MWTITAAVQGKTKRIADIELKICSSWEDNIISSVRQQTLPNGKQRMYVSKCMKHHPHQETMNSEMRKYIFLNKPQVQNFNPPLQ